MSPFELAMSALRAASDALNRVDLCAAEDALAEHDAIVREAFAEGDGLAVSEMEMLRAAQAELLAALAQVQQGVAVELQSTRKSGQAAKAYLGNAGA